MGPLDMSRVIPIGFNDKNVPWPDHSGVNDPEWAARNLNVDMVAWMQGSGLDGSPQSIAPMQDFDQTTPSNQIEISSITRAAAHE